MRGSSFVNVLFLLSSSLLLTTTLQQPTHGAKKPYIVYLGGHSHGRNPSSADMQTATDSHYHLLASVLGSHEKAKEAIFYSYNKHINGFAALLAEEEAAEIKKNENVVSVFLSKVHSLQTTRSWEFLGLEGHDVHGILGGGNTQNSAWRKTRFGENIIIANIDTGVWPEHPSFTDGGYGPIPPKWRGICQVNKMPTSNQTLCNRKLIGARIFHQGYEAQIGKISPDHHNNARDLVGHGTHTLAIAGGNFVRNASFIGNANGTAKGGSPRARVVAYKTCWDPLDENGCVESDIISAFDNAINDGVHVISISLNGHQRYPEDLLTDGISIGAFHAVSKGIVVVCSAGNEGPEAGTVKNVAPWSFTIAASSIDRKITNNITLGNGQVIEGASLATGFPSQSFPLIRSVDARLPNVAIQDALLCKPGTLDPNKVRGKIVICNRGHVMRPVQKGAEASRAGAIGLFMEQDKLSGNTLTSDPFVIGGSNYNQSAKTGGASYYDHTNTPVASMTNAKTFLGTTPAPIVASYSSRGPNVIQPAILKPDVTAPGVDILSAYTLAASPTNQQTDPRRILYNVLTGTSMATPHVAGIAGLVKKRHPNWSPAAIKSAIMTTATTRDNRNGPILDGVDDGVATPFAFGSGHVRPNLAIDPGLVYDIKISDYLKFLCASGYNERLVSSFYRLKKFECPKFSRVEDLNYPSITLPYLDTNLVNVTRILTNVGTPGTYTLSVKPPKGVKVIIVPKTLTFGKVLEKKAFRVFLQATKLAQHSRPAFGEFSWSDGKHVVRSPIVIANVEK